MTVLVGLLLTAAVTLTLVAVWGTAAILPGGVFGALATAIQVGAERLLRGGTDLPFDRLVARHGLGMGPRLPAVVLFVVGVRLLGVVRFVGA